MSGVQRCVLCALFLPFLARAPRRRSKLTPSPRALSFRPRAQLLWRDDPRRLRQWHARQPGRDGPPGDEGPFNLRHGRLSVLPRPVRRYPFHLAASARSFPPPLATRHARALFVSILSLLLSFFAPPCLQGRPKRKVSCLSKAFDGALGVGLMHCKNACLHSLSGQDRDALMSRPSTTRPGRTSPHRPARLSPSRLPLLHRRCSPQQPNPASPSSPFPTPRPTSSLAERDGGVQRPSRGGQRQSRGRGGRSYGREASRALI